MLRAAAIAVLCLITSFASAQQWTQPAAHHANVVQVRCGASGGSGVYVQHGALRGVLTAAHVVSGNLASVTFSDAYTASGSLTIDRYRNDIAWIFVRHPRLQPVPLASGNQFRAVEQCGFGGPENRLRHFAADLTGTLGGTIESNGPCTHGDSGGPWYALGTNQVIGIQSTGGEPIATYVASDGSRWPKYHSSQAVPLGPIRAFLDRVVETQGAGAVQKGGAGDLYPPIVTPGVQIAPPQTQPPIQIVAENEAPQLPISPPEDITNGQVIMFLLERVFENARNGDDCPQVQCAPQAQCAPQGLQVITQSRPGLLGSLFPHNRSVIIQSYR